MNESKLLALLESMTREELVSLLAGADTWSTAAVARLGIPAIRMSDGPNGARGPNFGGGLPTACFPAGIALAASWNTALLHEVGTALAVETRQKGASVLLAPMISMHRSALNGRNFECFSEDPWLAGELACAVVKGLQGSGVAATLKPIAGNESEFERHTISSRIGERALREIYLLPFEKGVVEGGAWAVMAAYNRVNGVFACEHETLLRRILKQEWGFDGVVMSDWFATPSTEAALHAGLDLEMPGPPAHRGDKLLQAVQRGTVDQATLKDSALRVLRLLARVEAFSRHETVFESAQELPAHRALIRRAGAEGCVLLKNDHDVLPIDPATARNVALIGPNAAQAQIMGGGSAAVLAHRRVSPVEGMRAQLPAGAQLSVEAGCDHYRLVPLLEQPTSVAYFNSPDCSGPIAHRATLPNALAMWFGDVAPGVDRERFSVRAVTSFTPAEDGVYTIAVASAGYSRVLLDGKIILDAWHGWQPGSTFFSFGCDELHCHMALAAGRNHELVVEYSSAVPTPLLLKGLRLGVHLPLGEAAMLRAVAAAAAADTAIVFVGLNGEWDTEGQDRPGIALPGRQDELISRVAAVNPNTVVVLQTGAPVTMPWLPQVTAVLQAWYPGQECGHAIADVLFGRVNPSGRLPQTFPKQLADNAATGNYPGSGGEVRYEEGVFIGYRHHERHDIAPLFAFGHGLSYTCFDYGALQLDALQLEPGGTLEVALQVSNVGRRSGQEVVQLYVADEQASVDRPPKELKAFRKLQLEAGASGTVRFKIDMRALAFFDERSGGWRAEAGRFSLLAGASSQDIRSRSTFVLTGDWHQAVAGAQ